MSVKKSAIIQRNFEEATHPLLELPETVALLTQSTVTEIDWKKQTFIPRHKKFTSDLVGVSQDGKVIHIEQETSPNADLSIRMLEYGTLIAVGFGLKRQINQYVYYTGDAPRTSRPVEHKLGWLMHKYLFIDAGSEDVCERLIKGPLPTAALALLVRTTDLAIRYSTQVAARIAALPEDQRKSVIEHCIRVSSLRRRRKLFEDILMSKLKYDPALFMNPAAEEMVVRALSGQIPWAIAQLPFPLSRVLKQFMLTEMGGWEMSKFLQHLREFTSEEQLMKTFGWTIEPVASNEQVKGMGMGKGI